MKKFYKPKDWDCFPNCRNNPEWKNERKYLTCLTNNGWRSYFLDDKTFSNNYPSVFKTSAHEDGTWVETKVD